MIRSTKNVSGPLPGRLTNQSCKVRKCVLEQASLVKTGERLVSGTVRNMESFVPPLPFEQRQAFGTAQRRSHAAQLEGLQRKALEVSQRLQGLELRETHLRGSFVRGTSQHQPSSKIHIASIIHHFDHHAFITFIMLSLHPNQAKRHPNARLEHHAADESSNPLIAGH